MKKLSPVYLTIVPVLVVGACALAFYYFVSDSLQVARQGREFGKGKVPKSCIDEAVRRYQPAHGLFEQTEDASFVSSCLHSSIPNKDFCRSVPEFSVVSQKQAQDWEHAQCSAARLQGEGCVMIFHSVVGYCFVSKKHSQ